MKLLVYMRDGRTVYRIKGRALFAKLVGRDPWHEESSAMVERGIWNPATGEYVWAPRPIRIRYLAKASISAVEEDTYVATETNGVPLEVTNAAPR